MARINLPNYNGDVRPLAISFICIIGFIFNVAWAIALIRLPVSDESSLTSLGYMVGPIAITQTILSIIAYIAIFRMKLWGLILYIIINVAFYVYGALYAQASLLSMIAHGVIAIIFLFYCTKMD